MAPSRGESGEVRGSEEAESGFWIGEASSSDGLSSCALRSLESLVLRVSSGWCWWFEERYVEPDIACVWF